MGERYAVTKEVAELIVKLYVGLQVPISLLPAGVLGVAGEAWNELHDKCGLYGWVKDDEVLKRMFLGKI